jgi:homocysteine S-methyltransferase
MARPLHFVMNSIVVLDGGLATELERRGADLSDPLWSARLLLDNPNLIRKVHESYFTAGADVATTASYQASIEGFARRGIAPAESLRLMRLSVELADQARRNTGGEGMVAGSVGPYGAILADGSEYRGNYGVSLETLAGFHGPRLQALIEAGADLLAIETCPSAVEALLVLELLQHWPGMRAWVSFTCRDEERTSEGQLIGEAVAAVARSPQVVAVGVNCVPPHLVEELLGRMRRATSLPLVVYPNAGETWDPFTRAWTGTPDTFEPARDVPRWIELGARWIGGCCRTTPATISEIGRVVRG